MVFELERQLVHKIPAKKIAQMSRKEINELPKKYIGLPIVFRRTLKDGSLGKESFRIGHIKRAYLNPREGVYADLRLEGDFMPMEKDAELTELVYKLPSE